jgi:hypothetical protein
MAGTKAGGIKARETNYLKYGADFYKRIGAKGGAKWAYRWILCESGVSTDCWSEGWTHFSKGTGKASNGWER